MEIVVKFNVKKYAAVQSFKLQNFEKEWDVLKNILIIILLIIILYMIYIFFLTN